MDDSGGARPAGAEDHPSPSTEANRRLGHFHSDSKRRDFLRAYDNLLAAWPSPPEQLDVETRHGTTHILASRSSTGTPIVLLHGVAVASPSWFADIAALCAAHPVYAIDTIGDAGRSVPSSAIGDGVEMSRWLDDVLAELDVRGAHMIGLSYGGWLALNQARHAPDRLASVTSVDPIAALGRPQGTFIVKIIPDALLAKLVRSDPALLRLIRRLNQGVTPDAPLLELICAGLRTFVAKLPAPKPLSDDDLRAIGIPALLLFCGASPVNHAQRAAQRARDLIPNATAEVVPGAGHLLPIEHPELFTSRVLGFIQEIDQARSTDR